MRRYLLFAGHCYYADGGWRDFVESFDDRDAAEAEGEVWLRGPREPHENFGMRWAHVVDGTTGEVVLEDEA